MCENFILTSTDVITAVENEAAINDTSSLVTGELAQVVRELKALKPPDGSLVKPLMPYMRFSNKMFEVVHHANPTLKLPEIGRIIGQQWRTLDVAEKQHYLQAYELEKEPYVIALHRHQCTAEFQEYLRRKGKLEERRRQLEHLQQFDGRLGGTKPTGGSFCREDQVAVSSVALSPQSQESKPEMPLRSSLSNQSMLSGGHFVSAANSTRQQVSDVSSAAAHALLTVSPYPYYQSKDSLAYPSSQYWDVPIAEQSSSNFSPQGMPLGMPPLDFLPFGPDLLSDPLRSNPLPFVESVRDDNCKTAHSTKGEAMNRYPRPPPLLSSSRTSADAVAVGIPPFGGPSAARGAAGDYPHPTFYHHYFQHQYRPQMPPLNYQQHRLPVSSHARSPPPPPAVTINISSLEIMPVVSSSMMLLQKPRAVDDSAAQKLASARFHRNHALMFEIFSGTPVPDADIVSQARLDLLRQQISHLERHRERLVREVDELERQYTATLSSPSAKRRKTSHYTTSIADDADVDLSMLFDENDELLMPKVRSEPITARKFTAMVAKAYNEMVDADRMRQERLMLPASDADTAVDIGEVTLSNGIVDTVND